MNDCDTIVCRPCFYSVSKETLMNVSNYNYKLSQSYTLCTSVNTICQLWQGGPSSTIIAKYKKKNLAWGRIAELTLWFSKVSELSNSIFLIDHRQSLTNVCSTKEKVLQKAILFNDTSMSSESSIHNCREVSWFDFSALSECFCCRFPILGPFAESRRRQLLQICDLGRIH